MVFPTLSRRILMRVGSRSIQINDYSWFCYCEDRKRILMKKKKTWIILSILALLLGGCFGDRIISEVVFAYHCKNTAGLFVYETVDLDESYIVPIPKDIRKRDSRFNVNSTEMMDKRRIQKDYEIKFPEFNTLFKLGPIESIKTIVTRKSDNQVIGEVVTFRTYGGWFISALPAENNGKYCPIGKTITYGKLHSQLVKEIFNVKKGV